jgi:hypothetical protein
MAPVHEFFVARPADARARFPMYAVQVKRVRE